jgi:ribonuclease P/MRP protein subunit POP5
MIRREKRRYLALKILGDDSLEESDVISAVWDSILQLFGECGASQTSLSLIKYDLEKNYGVLRCSLKSINIVRTALASVTVINEKPTIMHVLAVSGTLKALLKKTS